MKKSKIILIIIGLIILSLLVYLISPTKLVDAFKNFNVLFLPLIIIIMLIEYFLAALNTWVLVLPYKKVSIFKLTKYTFFTLFYSTFTPGKIADFFMIFYLKRNKINVSKSTLIILFDKSISLILKSVLGIIGAIFVLKKLNYLTIGAPLLIIIAISFLFLIILSKRFRNFIKKVILRKYSKLFKGFSKNFKKYIKNNKKELFYNFLITVVKTIFETSLLFLLFLSFGQMANFIDLLLVFSLLTVINFLFFPIGISGLGIREALGIFMYSTINIDPAIVFNSYILRLLLVYLLNYLTFIKYSSELNLIKKSSSFKKFIIK